MLLFFKKTVAGLGDIRGHEEDRHSIRKILEYASKISALHLICFLLPPDVITLSETFQQSVIELIRHLPRPLDQNVVFCFTKTAGTSYQVWQIDLERAQIGATAECLQRLLIRINFYHQEILPLKKDTIYTFDNVSYRFFCIRQEGVSHFLVELCQMDPILFDMDEEMCEKSFYHSQGEMLRLLNHAARVKPLIPRPISPHL